MSRRPRRGLIVGALVVLLGTVGAAAAQDQAKPSLELWPEIDTWVRLAPAWRLSIFAALSRNIETAYREGSLILQADLAFGKFKSPFKRRLMDEDRAREMKRFLVRGGYLTGRSLEDDGEAFQERTGLLELHLRTPIKGKVLISHRLRADLRWLDEAHDFSTRLRYRLMVEKEYVAGRVSIVPYINGEAYYDSRYAAINRFRWIGGLTAAPWTHLAIEANMTYQYDSRSSVSHLWALNTILHIFF